MAGKCAAMVLTAPKKLEMREFPIPDIGQEDALLRMEACGICGSDYEMYEGAYPLTYPFIPGHEPLCVIEKIGSIAARRWGVGEGDRVAVEPMVGCGYCRECRSGFYRLCSGGGRSYGTIPIQNGPALLGVMPNTCIWRRKLLCHRYRGASRHQKGGVPPMNKPDGTRPQHCASRS